MPTHKKTVHQTRGGFPSVVGWFRSRRLHWRQSDKAIRGSPCLTPTHFQTARPVTILTGLFSDCRYHGYSFLGPGDPLHPEEVVFGIQNAAGDVRNVDSIVEEREREELGEELGMIWWTVENEITYPTDFVPAMKGGSGEKES